MGEEQVQVTVRGEPVEAGGAARLGRQHRGEPLVGQVGECRVVHVHGRVHDSPQGAPAGVHGVGDPSQGALVGDVGGVDGGPYAPLGEVPEQRGGLGRVLAPAGHQGQVPGAQVGQPAGGGRPEAARTAGDQVGAVAVEPGARGAGSTGTGSSSGSKVTTTFPVCRECWRRWKASSTRAAGWVVWGSGR